MSKVRLISNQVEVQQLLDTCEWYVSISELIGLLNENKDDSRAEINCLNNSKKTFFVFRKEFTHCDFEFWTFKNEITKY